MRMALKFTLIVACAYLGSRLGRADDSTGSCESSTHAKISPLTASASLTETLTSEQVGMWRENGYVVVNDVFPSDLVQSAVEEVSNAWPDSKHHQPEENHNKAFSDGKYPDGTFPTEFPSVNKISLHPRLLRAVEQLLNASTEDIRMMQCEVWGKYGVGKKTFAPTSNQEQRHHLDFPNYSITYTSDWYSPTAVSVLIYFCDEIESGGSTAVVSRQGESDPAYTGFYAEYNPGYGSIPWINDKEKCESFLAENYPDVYEFRRHLYEREKKIQYVRGTVLFYRPDIWHRGTNPTPGGVRFSQNMVFARSGMDWFHNFHRGWATKSYMPDFTLEKIIGGGSIDQRNVLGFPPPGHSYWTKRTLMAVTRRFKDFNFDPEPYERELK